MTYFLYVYLRIEKESIYLLFFLKKFFYTYFKNYLLRKNLNKDLEMIYSKNILTIITLIQLNRLVNFFK